MHIAEEIILMRNVIVVIPMEVPEANTWYFNCVYEFLGFLQLEYIISEQII